MTDYFELVVSPHFRPDGTKHPNTFDARLAGSDTVLCVSETPLFDAARALLAQGKVNPDDTLVMRHAGSDHYAFRGRVGVAAGLRVAEDASGVRLRKYQPYRQVPPCIEQTPSLAPYPPPAAETYARDLEAEDSAFFSDDESDGWAYNQGFYDGVQAALQGSTDWVQDVRDFHKACGTVDPTEPTWPSYDKRSLRYHLQFEEGNELSAELLPEHCLFVGQFLPHAVESQEHLVALAKEIVDVIYVAVGTALSCGININAVWEAVHASNMAKVDPAIGKVRRRDDGKILKPEGWQTPDIKKVLFPE